MFKKFLNGFKKLLADERGIGMLGAGLIGAGVGAIGSLFRKKPKKTQLKFDPVNITQMGFPVGQALNERIIERLKAEGGFGPEFVETQTAPGTAQIRANLPETLREIQSAASGMGLGRATPVARMKGLAQAQAGRDVSQLIAKAKLLNLQQQKIDQARAVMEGLGFSRQEIAARLGSAEINLNRAIAQAKLEESYQEASRGYRDIGIGAILTGAGAGVGLINPLAGAAISGFGNIFGGGDGFNVSSLTSLDIKDLIDQIGAVNRSGPFTSGYNLAG